MATVFAKVACLYLAVVASYYIEAWRGIPNPSRDVLGTYLPMATIGALGLVWECIAKNRRTQLGKIDEKNAGSARDLEI